MHLITIIKQLYSSRRRCESALLGALIITSCTALAAGAQAASSDTGYAQDAQALRVTIQQTDATIDSDRRLQHQYAERVKLLEEQLAALKKTPSSQANAVQAQAQLNQAKQMVASMAANVTNLGKWVAFWQQKEQADEWNENNTDLDKVASSIFDTNGSRYTQNELQGDQMFIQEQEAHDARLAPLARRYR